VGERARRREDVSVEPAVHGRQSLGDPSVAAALRVILLGKTVGKMQHTLTIGDGANRGV
jgi:hypothetical protein